MVTISQYIPNLYVVYLKLIQCYKSIISHGKKVILKLQIKFWKKKSKRSTYVKKKRKLKKELYIAAEDQWTERWDPRNPV